jgi:hypothetical protein
MSIKEKMIEGKYNYFNKESLYTEENFQVEREQGLQGNLIFSSEVLSRVRTGEFLKINVEYVVSKKFDPVNMKITRQLGGKQSSEEYTIDQKTKNVVYEFNSDGKTHYFEKVVSQMNHIIAPSFVTSMLMVNQKKIDPVQRTPYSLISTENVWEYKGGFTEKEIYVELIDLEPQEIVIDGSKIKASHCKLMQVDSNGSIIDDSQVIWLSKHFNIPYLVKFGEDFEIRVETLKKFEEAAKKIF